MSCPSATFETFAFPWPPGQEPVDNARVQAIAAAPKELNEKREAWLNPPDLAPAGLKKRTLTNLYNDRPTWLHLAHRRLDAAVFAAYAWPAGLLALNLARTRQDIRRPRATQTPSRQTCASPPSCSSPAARRLPSPPR